MAATVRRQRNRKSTADGEANLTAMAMPGKLGEGPAGRGLLSKLGFVPEGQRRTSCRDRCKGCGEIGTTK